MKVEIGIIENNSQTIANQLNKFLADEYVLYTKTRNAHWNVEGEDFYDKHKFFELQFGQLDEIIDRIAERIRSIGHYAGGSLRLFLELTHLSESDEHKNDSRGYIKDLLQDHESIIMHYRENIHSFTDKYRDTGTSDFITGIMEEHEKMAWFLRSHLG